MSYTFKLTEEIEAGGRQIKKTQSITGTGRSGISGESVADAQTDAELGFTLDVSACKAFVINSTKNVTVETNNGSTPDDTLTLVANVPYVWHENSEHTFLLTTDVTALFVTNASGAAATIDVEAVFDSTP